LQAVIDGLEDWTVVANIDAPPTIDLAGILAYAETRRSASPKGGTRWKTAAARAR
jgi:hypothetical protein